MSKTKLISPGIPNYTLKRNLRLNDKYISNDGGDEGIRVDDSGNVGIGTATPTDKLTIQETNMYHQFGDYTYYTSHSLGIRVLNGGYLQMGTDGDNSVHIHTNGFANKRMSITSAGNVGIGTTAPGEKLDVNGSIKTTEHLKLLADSKYILFGADSEVQLLHNSNRGLTLHASSNASTGTKLNFLRERQGSGTPSTVGGTTSAGQDNDEIGELLFQGYNNAGTPEKIDYAKIVASINDASDGTEDGTIELYTMNNGTLTEGVRLGATGLGIGTASPGAKLHVYGDGNLNGLIQGSSTVNYIQFQDSNTGLSSNTSNGTTVGTNTGVFHINNREDKNIQFGTNDTTRMVIKNDGNVGIGTTSPGVELQVAGDIKAVKTSGTASVIAEKDTNYAKINADGTSGFLSWGHASADKVLRFIGNDSEVARFDTDGYFLIGTTSTVQSAKLHVTNGHIGMTDAYDLFWGAARNTKIVASQSSEYMKFFVAGTEAAMLNSDGYLGLGTSSPVAHIHARSSVSTAPIFLLENNVNDAEGAHFWFKKDKGAAGADGDDIGIILFQADNSAQELTHFAKIVGEISEATDGDEAGKLSFYVAESNGSSSQLTAGLVIEGEHATDGEIDVTIAAGSASMTTVSGNLTVTGDIDIDGNDITSPSSLTISPGNHFSVDAPGDIILDSGSGDFVAKNAGTEFSATDSSYAGMILGYTCLLNDSADTSYNVTAAFVTIDSTTKVTFVAPPSGNVEIFASVFCKWTTNRWLQLGLSDNATYNPVDVTHEHFIGEGDETDEMQVNHRWVITGLTANSSYTYWIGAKAEQASRVYLYWGGDATGEYAPFIVKATALPATIYDGS
tara:strand:+ start:5996 stop:8530 length:2535 start_codon:yes stop_codon:yes gene_type:complete